MLRLYQNHTKTMLGILSWLFVCGWLGSTFSFTDTPLLYQDVQVSYPARVPGRRERIHKTVTQRDFSRPRKRWHRAYRMAGDRCHTWQDLGTPEDWKGLPLNQAQLQHIPYCATIRHGQTDDKYVAWVLITNIPASFATDFRLVVI